MKRMPLRSKAFSLYGVAMTDTRFHLKAQITGISVACVVMKDDIVVTLYRHEGNGPDMVTRKVFEATVPKNHSEDLPEGDLARWAIRDALSLARNKFL